MQEYFSLLTATGANLLINAVANKTPVKLSKIAVSDSEIAPSEAATALENTKHEFAINSLTQDPQNPSILNVEGVIPSNVGGFNIRKFAIFTQSGEMFAVGRVPLSYKPALNQGAGSDLVFKIRILIGNVSNIELKVDNSVVLATRDWSEKTFLKLIDAYNKQESDEKYAQKSDVTDGLKIGSYLLWSSQSVTPAGFVVCDGRSLKKSEYAELFTVIGYTYGGSGDNFNLPNFADGKFMRSIGGNAAALGQVQQDEIKSHTHGVGQQPGIGQSNNGGSGPFAGSNNHIQSGATGGNETRPYNMAVVVLIKAKEVKEPNANQIDKSIYATEAKAGVAKLKNSITGKAEDVAVTEKAVSDAIEANKSIGIDQAWQDVTSQRRLNETYTNTTGKPIYVQVNINNAGNVLFTFKINNTEIEHNEDYRCVMNYIIPPNATYKVYSQNGATNYVYTKWYELR